MKKTKSNKTISIKCKPPKDGVIARPSDFQIKLSDGTNLGNIRSLSLKVNNDGIPILKLESYVTELELELLQKNTELKVTVIKEKE